MNSNYSYSPTPSGPLELIINACNWHHPHTSKEDVTENKNEINILNSIFYFSGKVARQIRKRAIHPISYLLWIKRVGQRRIGYPSNFKISGSGSLSGGSVILLSLSGSGVREYPGVGYLSKNYNIRRISGSGFGSLK